MGYRKERKFSSRCTTGTGAGPIREVKPAGDILREIVEEAEREMAEIREAFVV